MTRRLFVLVAAVALAVALTASGASAAALKVPLVGPEANVFCVDVEPADESQSPGPGVVIFNLGEDGVVHANVRLKRAQPNTTYVVRLIQGTPAGTDCQTVDAEFTTNVRGNGGVTVKEPVQADAVAAQVIIDTERLIQTPTYRGSESYPLS